MKHWLAVISLLTILSGCTAIVPTVAPTATNTPRPTVTPLGSGGDVIVVTQIVIATETRPPAPPQPTAVPTPTNTPTPEPLPTTAPVANPDGLVLHYSFDTDNSRTIIDQSGMGNTGQINGPTFTTNGRLGGALVLDGVNDFICVPASPSLDVNQHLTMMAFFNAEDYADQRPILEWSRTDRTGVHMWVNVKGYQWNGKGTGANLIDVNGDEVNRVISITDPPPGTWHHLAVTYDGDMGFARVYLDGQLAQNAVLSVAALQTQYDLYIGTRPLSGAYFKGRLDEIRIYNRVLSEPEIATLAHVAPPQSGLTIIAGPALQIPRMQHTATRLPDGRVLIVGGSQDPNSFLAEVKLFDPVTNLSRRVASLHTARHGHTATLLPNGRVLIIGGYTLPQQWLDDAEVYDPVVDSWTVVPPLSSHGVEHTANLMKDGRVLVVGGCIGSGVCTGRVEIFNPSTNTWTEAAPLQSNRASHTAHLLNDGRVLVVGGGSGVGDNIPAGGDALLYNPSTNSWSATNPMVKMRSQARAARLSDGRVLVAGGITLEDQSRLIMSASAEVYDPASNGWTSVASLTQARYQFALVVLPDSRVLAIGGARDYNNRYTENSFIHEIELYEPTANAWRSIGKLPQSRSDVSATLLQDGRIWVTGGRDFSAYRSDTWLIAVSTP